MNLFKSEMINDYINQRDLIEFYCFREINVRKN